MKTINIYLFATVLSAITFSSQASTVLISDDFTDGTFNGWEALNTSGGSSGQITFTVEDDTSGINGGNALEFITTSNNRMAGKIWGDAITLGDMDSLTVSLDYRFVSGPPDSNFSLAFRFFDSASGNWAGIAMNAASDASNSGTFQSSEVANESRFNSFNHGTDPQTVTVSINSFMDGLDKQRQISYFFGTNDPAGGNIYTFTDNVSFTFDGFGVAFAGTTTDGIRIDNVNVTTTIPEPSSILLLVVGLAGLLWKRRARASR